MASPKSKLVIHGPKEFGDPWTHLKINVGTRITLLRSGPRMTSFVELVKIYLVIHGPAQP